MMFLIVLFYFTYLIWPSCTEDHNKIETLDQHDYAGRTEKVTLMTLTEELLRDSTLKMRQLLDVRNAHASFTAFGQGLIIGRVREKYRFMLETYRDIYDVHIQRTILISPAVRYYRPMHYILAMETMHKLFLELDKLVDVLLTQAQDDLDKSTLIVSQHTLFSPNSTFVNVTQRPRNLELDQEPEHVQVRHTPPPGRRAVDIIKEELEKSALREKYLIKKLGLPRNSTTMKKRFQKRWPVEETWSLDKYYKYD